MSATNGGTSVGQLIRNAKLPTAEYELCLNTDLAQEYADRLHAITSRQAAPQDSLAGDPQLTKLREELAELEGEMSESMVTLVFRAAPRATYRRLKDTNPPRTSQDGTPNMLDVRFGCNVDGFFNDLVRTCLVEPVLTQDELDLLIDERLVEWQWDEITTLVGQLNTKKVNVPFGSSGSRSRTTSA